MRTGRDSLADGFGNVIDKRVDHRLLGKGGELFFATLVTYLTHFAGRSATPVTAFGPAVPDWDRAWRTLRDHLGLPDHVSEGDSVRFSADELPPIDGVVYAVNEDTIGVRTSDGLYRFLKGFGGPIIVGHHIFSHIDQDQAEQAWQTWLHRTFA